MYCDHTYHHRSITSRTATCSQNHRSFECRYQNRHTERTRPLRHLEYSSEFEYSTRVSTLETDDAVRDVKQMIDMSDLNIETKHDALEMLASLKFRNVYRCVSSERIIQGLERNTHR
jgi:hypothetical protein